MGRTWHRGLLLQSKDYGQVIYGAWPDDSRLAVRGARRYSAERGRESFSNAQNLDENDSRPRFPMVRHGLQQPSRTFTTGC